MNRKYVGWSSSPIWSTATLAVVMFALLWVRDITRYIVFLSETRSDSSQTLSTVGRAMLQLVKAAEISITRSCRTLPSQYLRILRETIGCWPLTDTSCENLILSSSSIDSRRIPVNWVNIGSNSDTPFAIQFPYPNGIRAYYGRGVRMEMKTSNGKMSKKRCQCSCGRTRISPR